MTKKVIHLKITKTFLGFLLVLAFTLGFIFSLALSKNPKCNLVSQNTTQTDVSPKESKNEDNLVVGDQYILEKYQNARVVGGVLVQKIQRCSLSGKNVYVLENSSTKMPKVIIGEKDEYLFSCPQTNAGKDCQEILNCSKISN